MEIKKSLYLDGDLNTFSTHSVFTPDKWTYLFDHTPLVNRLEKYVDFNKLKPNGNSNALLIITAVNVLTAEPLTFDSAKQQITPKHIMATTGYPTYYFQWAEVEKGVYAWDGSLLSNTPFNGAKLLLKWVLIIWQLLRK